MDGTRTVKDLADVVPGERGMLQPEDLCGEVRSVWVARVGGG